MAVVRNIYAHAARMLDDRAINRLNNAGHHDWAVGDVVSLAYDELDEYRARLRSLLRAGAVDSPTKDDD